MPASDARLCGSLARLALDAARQGAAEAVRLRGAPLDIATKSTATDMVTNADRAVEQLVVGHLLAARPDDGVVGEEGATRRADAEVVWVIDPIDGTTNFVYGFPGWSCSVAARRPDGTLLAGAVVDPLHGDHFVAAAGGGATRNGEVLRLAEPPPLSRALVATGFGYDPERREAQAAQLSAIIARIRDVRRMGAASVDLCSVAAGRVDGYYEQGLAEWDLAAGTLIAREAGAKVEELGGGPPRPGGVVVAAHPALWDPLADLVEAL